MGRSAMAGALISMALGSALALPVAAQAATSAPTAGIAPAATSAGHHAAVPDIPPNGQWQLVGTYPSLAACTAEGSYLVRTYRTDTNFFCTGSYQLWVYFVPGL